MQKVKSIHLAKVHWLVTQTRCINGIKHESRKQSC